MKEKAQWGHVFILSVIILLAIFAFFILIPMRSAWLRSAPVVQQVFWKANGQNITAAYVGQEVEAYVTIKAKEDYLGPVIVKVRKDVAYWFDSDHTFKTFSADLKSDQTTELQLAFAPDSFSTGNLRGYFVEVEFPSTSTNWVMENLYPPRLKVVEQEPGIPV